MSPTGDAPGNDSPNSKRIAWRVAQTILAIAFVGFAAHSLWRQWHDPSVARLHVELQPGWLALSSIVVLGTYLLLIEIWRRVLRHLGARVPLALASRVWFVSNLGKYVPGKVWQLTTMAGMMNRKGVSLATAGSAAVLVAVANVVAGFVLVLAVSAQSVRALGPRAELALVWGTILLLAMTLTAPITVRWAVIAFNRLTRRSISLVVPARVTWESIGGYLITWVLYGIAFELFAVAVVGHAGGGWTAYVATFTLSYLVGYLWLPAPGGIGAREWAMSTVFVALNLGTPAEAAVITVASRLWLTLLEIVPGLFYLTRPFTTVDDTARPAP